MLGRDAVLAGLLMTGAGAPGLPTFLVPHAGSRSVLETTVLVTWYGNPHSGNMGVLGRQTGAERAARARTRTRRNRNCENGPGRNCFVTRVEIPPDRWTAKLDEFTRVHEWALVSIDIWTAGQGRRREVTDLPLLGVSANRPGTDRTVLMSMACAGDGHITHVVTGVTRVAVEQMANGADSALLVDSTDGTRTVLRLTTAVLPEKTADGSFRA